MKFLLARHGEIAANLRKVYAGLSNASLTETGRQQAEALAESLVDRSVGVLYSSPVERALETARIVGKRLGLAPVADDGLIELRMGPWEGLSEDEVARRFPTEWATWGDRPADLKLPGRETLAELDRRVSETMRRLRQRHPEDVILGVTHIAPIRAALLRQRGHPLNTYRTIPVANCSLLEFDA